MGDLQRQLTEGDVDQLTPDSVASCPTVLARRVVIRPARRRVLVIFVTSRSGSVSLRRCYQAAAPQ